MFFSQNIFLVGGQTIIYRVYIVITNFPGVSNQLSAGNSDMNKHSFCPQGDRMQR